MAIDPKTYGSRNPWGTSAYPNLLPGSHGLENDLRGFEKQFDLNSDVDRGTFVQQMLEHWRVESFGTLRGAAAPLDIEVTPRTLHDELIKKIVGRWIKELLAYRARPTFEIGNLVRYKNMLDRSAGNMVVLEADVRQVRVQETHIRWVDADSIEKVEG
jgi:hypothetical protein